MGDTEAQKAHLMKLRHKLDAQLGFSHEGNCDACPSLLWCRRVERRGLQLPCELSDDDCGIKVRDPAYSTWMHKSDDAEYAVRGRVVFSGKVTYE